MSFMPQGSSGEKQTGTGLLVHQSAGSALIGAGIGGVLGGALGYLLHKDKVPTTIAHEPETPYLTSPVVERLWVPARVEGEKYISGHYEFLIKKSSVWSR